MKKIVFLIGFMVIKVMVGAQSVTIDTAVRYQQIVGFGGVNMPNWISDLTSAQTQLAFGNNPGELGLSILRIKVPSTMSRAPYEVRCAKQAYELGARIIGSPWSPPDSLKSNSNTTGGYLLPEYYDDYADHLLSFANYMSESGAPLYGISVQNEPDIDVTYESCDWYAYQMVNFLREQGSKFSNITLIAPESYNFNQTYSDSILNDSVAASYVDVVGGHIYGSGLNDYPLARNRGKAIWMTEHLDTDTTWSGVFATAQELNDCMQANYNAYLWWYIRRFYGLINDDGEVTKRGYVMMQYSKFIRPGFFRVEAGTNNLYFVDVTAYTNDTNTVLVFVNESSSAKEISVEVSGTTATQFTRFTTSEIKNMSNGGAFQVVDGVLTAALDAYSVTTFATDATAGGTVGVFSRSAKNSITLFPNPATESITLQLCDSDKTEVYIYNSVGVLVRFVNTNRFEQNINVADFATGVYLVKCMTKGGYVQSKFIKN